MKLSAPWREALAELWRHKLRTLLTLLGMIFGVASIVAMQGIGEGSRREALRLVESLGLRNLIVEANDPQGDALKEVRVRSLGVSQEDATAALDVVPEADQFAAEKKLKAWSIFSDSGRGDAVVSGVSPELFGLLSLRFAQGRALNANDDATLAPVAVLGHQAAQALFPSGSAVGKLFKVNHVWLRVVGVLADRDLEKNSFEGVSVDSDANHIYVPLASARARFRFDDLESSLDRFVLQIRNPDRLGDDARILSGLMDKRHAGVDDFRLIVPQQLYRQSQKTQHIFDVVMGTIAGVSLLVGGIGIMNIMLASVLERRREIGLLRAIGARKKDILVQFVREAGVICGVGATLGVLLGGVLAYAIAIFAEWNVAWSPTGIVLSVFACTLIGMVFSIYPARHASEMDPIAAIRGE